MSIAAEAALLDVRAQEGRAAAEIQRSLAQGRCAACDLPVATGHRRRRPCICLRCEGHLAWCSTCQRPRPHEAFAKCRSSRNGLNKQCKACRKAQKLARRPRPQCARKGCTSLAAESTSGNYHRLCAACLETHAWCSDCDRARLRREFTRGVRLGRRHAGICLACHRARRPATGVKRAEQEAANERYVAIRDYAQAHPTALRADIAHALGVTQGQIDGAQEALGFTIGQGPKRARALARYAAVAELDLPTIMAREGLSYRAAVCLRAKARRTLAQRSQLQ